MEWDPSFSFAQAAMMLAENTNTYSKNVELLYNMVYTTLDSLSKTDGKGGASSAILKKLRKRVVGFQEFDAGFELLDAQFEQPARGIDLKDSEGIVLNGAHLIRRVPLLLLPREDADKGGGSTNKQTTQFKTSNCWVSEDSGCLLLDPKFELLQSRDNLARGGRGSFGGRLSMNGPLVGGSLPSPPIEEPVLAIGDEDFSVPDAFDPVEEDYDQADLAETPELEAPAPVVQAPPTPSALFPPLPETAGPVRSSKRLPDIEAPPVKDPWIEHNPHVVASGGRSVGRLKMSKCWQDLENLRSLSELVPFLSMEMGAKFESRCDLFGPVCWPELFETESVGSKKLIGKFFDAEIRLAERQLEKQARVTTKAQRNSVASAPMNGDSSSAEEEFRVAHSRDSIGGGPSSRTSIAAPMLSREERRLQEDRQRTALLEQVVETSKREYDEFIRQHLVSRDEVEGLESGARTGMQSLLHGIEKVPEMLYANIRKWQDNLEPLLEEQNARPNFDLDGYLVSILDKLKLTNGDDEAINAFLHDTLGEDIGEDVSKGGDSAAASTFESLVKGEPKWNVCRLFLSTLILTNNGNVEIFESAAPGDSTPRASGTQGDLSSTSPLASSAFQVKLKNAEKNLRFAVQDNAGVTGDIPIITNQGLPPLEPVGDVPFKEDEE